MGRELFELALDHGICTEASTVPDLHETRVPSTSSELLLPIRPTTGSPPMSTGPTGTDFPAMVQAEGTMSSMVERSAESCVWCSDMTTHTNKTICH